MSGANAHLYALQSGLAMLISRMSWRISAADLGGRLGLAILSAKMLKSGAAPPGYGIGFDDLSGRRECREPARKVQ